tara:strand:- start:1009 stop:2091 length:1083 start_codon:yes stop_codon:yes gene_type:complete
LSTLSSQRDIALHEEVVAKVRSVASGILGQPIVASRRLGCGRNNVTLLIETPRGRYVAKHYPKILEDDWDRLRAEAAGLGFLNAAGVSAVPVLIGTDAASRVSVMTECGVPADCTACRDDIEACLAFAKRLHYARTLTDAESLPLAAEACLAPKDIVDQVVDRRRRLGEVGAGHPELSRFLSSTFDPALDAYRRQAYAALAASDIGPADQLLARWQTLSPSDFGLHNAVRGDDGGLTFVDFEYFGWDDPVRIVSDFLLHPGHLLDDDAKRQFVYGCYTVFGNDPQFLNRLRALYCLVGLRWCLILLNEFLPERLARRRAAGNSDKIANIRARQLRKADQMLTGLEISKGVLSTDVFSTLK